MHTCGLVLTLVDDPAQASLALVELASAEPFTVGAPNGPCRAVVMETGDTRSAQAWHDWLAGLPGVLGIEVVFVHWDEVETEVSHVGA